MKNQVKLFINGLEVDLKDDLNILFTYQLEERTNPTIVKNHYSKTIQIEETEGTPHNHLVFGSFFQNDRRIGAGGTNGNQFDPSKRVPFELYVNGDLQESGYAQLKKVTQKGKQIMYNIQLYGGLGDFWYNLHMKDNGETRSLADLKWNNRDSFGNVLPEENEFDFRITKDFVMDAWNHIGMAGNENEKQLLDTINFATLYDGVPSNFDADKMLVNTYDNPVFPSTIISGTSSYTAYDGYGVAELDQSYDGWAVRDLRSYLQKPVLSVRRLVETCCDPVNNGGYTVDLDPNFFNNNNPYYQNAYLTLPSLIIDDSDDSSSYGGNSATFNSVRLGKDPSTSPASTGSNTTYYCTWSGSSTVDVSGSTISSVGGVLDLTDYPFSYVDAGVDVGVLAEASTQLELRQDGMITTTTGIFNRERYTYFATCEYVQLVAFDADTNERLGGSDIYRFATYSEYADNQIFGTLRKFFTLMGDSTYDVTTVLGPDFYPANIVDIRGTYKYDSVTRASKYTSWDDYTTWRLTIERLPKVDHMKFKIVTNNLYGSKGYQAESTYYNYFWNKLGFFGRSGLTTANKVIVNYGGSFTLSVPSQISTGAKITKKKLLSTDESAADFLLSYSKLFGLYWYKDVYSKTVYCRLRNNFFTGEVEDINERIDYSKDYITTPILFDKHFYSMTQKTPDTKYSKKYEELYSRVYGSQKINTNFNFNNDTTELYDGNVFSNLIQARDTSNMYRTYYNKFGKSLPTPIIGGIDYTLVSGSQLDQTITQEFKPTEIDFTRTVDFYARGGYDFMTHPAAFTEDGDTRNSVSNKYTLLFYDGYIYPRDAEGNQIRIYLTDDLNDMITLNQNRCWLSTYSPFDKNGNMIAFPLPYIPNFSRYYQNRLSWDFGTPQEYYVDDLSLGEEGSLYNRYWKNYLNDQFNANTRMVTCYVKFDRRIMEDSLRKFYWFNNRLWVLNKVIDYSVTKYNTVKCEFISIDDTNNYTAGQTQF